MRTSSRTARLMLQKVSYDSIKYKAIVTISLHPAVALTAISCSRFFERVGKIFPAFFAGIFTIGYKNENL